MRVGEIISGIIRVIAGIFSSGNKITSRILSSGAYLLIFLAFLVTLGKETYGDFLLYIFSYNPYWYGISLLVICGSVTYYLLHVFRLILYCVFLGTWLILIYGGQLIIFLWRAYWHYYFFERYEEAVGGEPLVQASLTFWRYYIWRVRQKVWIVLRLLGVVVVTSIFCFNLWFKNWWLPITYFFGFNPVLLAPVGHIIWSYSSLIIGSFTFYIFYYNIGLVGHNFIIYNNIFLNSFNLFWNWRPRTGFGWFVLYIKTLYKGRKLFNKRYYLWGYSNVIFWIWLLESYYLGLPIAIAQTICEVSLDHTWLWPDLLDKEPWPLFWDRFETSLETYCQQYQRYQVWYRRGFMFFLLSKRYGNKIATWLHNLWLYRYKVWVYRQKRKFRYLLFKFWGLFYGKWLWLFNLMQGNRYLTKGKIDISLLE